MATTTGVSKDFANRGFTAASSLRQTEKKIPIFYNLWEKKVVIDCRMLKNLYVAKIKRLNSVEISFLPTEAAAC